MDEEQKRKVTEAKATVSAWLASEGRERFAASPLTKVSDKIDAYVSGIVADPDAHNVFELLALRRSIEMCDRHEFRPKEARKALAVIGALKFPTDKGMRTIRLSPVQTFAIANIYGFWDGDRRVIRNAMLFVPRKFGKTTLSSGIAVYEFLFGDSDAQVFTCANSYDQAKICFDSIRNTLKTLDNTGKRFKVNREKVFDQAEGRSAFIRCLASDPSTLDGLNATCYILDEFSQAKSADLRNVMATSTGARRNPLELIITTASSVLESPCVDTLNAYKSILLGDASDDSVFAQIFQPDVDDRPDDPRTWHKVQPHLGVTIQDDYYERQWMKAQLTADDAEAFHTKLLNEFVTNDRQTWLSYQEIESLFSPLPYDFEANVGRSVSELPVCMVSFDLSVWDDLSAVCYEIYDPKSSKFHFHLDYYMPEESVSRHVHSELYRRWASQGHLHLLPGKVIDYLLIAKDIIGRNGKVRIAGIGYDPYHSKQMVSILQAFGAGPVLQPLKQTYGAYTGSVESLELMVKSGLCTFSPNPITAWCFANAVVPEDNHGNRMPQKPCEGSSQKIDGAICCCMTQTMFNNAKR